MKLKFGKYKPDEILPDIYTCLLLVKETYKDTNEEVIQFCQSIYSFNDECFYANGEKVINTVTPEYSLEILGYCVYDAMQLSQVIQNNEDVIIDIPKSNQENNSEEFFKLFDRYEI